VLSHTVTAPASLSAHAPPVATHLALTGSQHPVGQVALAQQMSPPAPHAAHVPPLHTVPLA
jgi:hypothetical protein